MRPERRQRLLLRASLGSPSRREPNPSRSGWVGKEPPVRGRQPLQAELAGHPAGNRIRPGRAAPGRSLP